MKRFFVIAVCLLLCLGVFAGCDSIESKIGEKASVSMLDAIQPELEGAGYDTFKRYGAGDIAVFEVELKEKLAAEELSLTGKVTGVLTGDYENPETGDWVKQIAIGVSASSDVDVLVQYYSEMYKTELDENRASVVDGGWIINVTVSSMEIAQPVESEA